MEVTEAPAGKDAPYGVIIEKSPCGQFVRLTVHDRSETLTMTEWSWLISNPGLSQNPEARSEALSAPTCA